MLTVMKFGGGVLRNAEEYRRAAAIIRRRADRQQGTPDCAVVVSAVYGVTEKLIAASRALAQGERDVDEAVADIIDQHLVIADGLDDEELRRQTRHAIEEMRSRLAAAFSSVKQIGRQWLNMGVEAPQRDFIESFGERLSAVLFAAFVQEAGVKATALGAEDIGLVTDGRPSAARPLLTQVERNFRKTVLPLIEDRVVPVVTGFYGVSLRGEVTTFGRGGTDYSGAILAYCVNADVLEIWKDVPGFMTADPTVAPRAQRLDQLSYDEAEELSYFGAGILHPRTIAPLREKRIPGWVKDVDHPDDPGTRIDESRSEHRSVIKSIAAKKDIVVVNVKGSQPSAQGFANAVFGALAEQGVSVDAIATSQTDISFTIDREQLPETVLALNTAHSEAFQQWFYEEDLALLGIVGEGMKSTTGVAARVFTSLAQADPPVNIEMISQGGSEINISLVVAADRVDDAIRAIHGEFFEE